MLKKILLFICIFNSSQIFSPDSNSDTESIPEYEEVEKWENEFICQVCSLDFNSKLELDNHIENKHFICAQCSKNLKNIIEVNLHKKEAHIISVKDLHEKFRETGNL